jgi:hypothetical protein
MLSEKEIARGMSDVTKALNNILRWLTEENAIKEEYIAELNSKINAVDNMMDAILIKTK